MLMVSVVLNSLISASADNNFQWNHKMYLEQAIA